MKVNYTICVICRATDYPNPVKNNTPFLFKLQTMLQFPNSTAVRPPAVTMEMVQHAEDEWVSNDCLNFCKKVNCMYFFISFNQ